LKYFEKGFNEVENVEFKLLRELIKSAGLSILAELYILAEEYEIAEEKLWEALSDFETFQADYKGQEENIASIYMSLGTIYLKKEDFTKSTEYLKIALDICHDYFLTSALADCYELLGETYETSNEYDLAIEYYEKALEINREKSSANNIWRNEYQIGRVYQSQGGLEKAVEWGGIFTREGAREVIKMAEEIAGGERELRERPFLSFITCVMSPLKIDQLSGNKFMDVARKGLPIAAPAEPLTGLTSPVTIAGTLATIHAETLSKLVAAQIVNPGTPVIYACTSSSTDLYTMNYLSGSIEMGLINAGAAQMAQYIKLPNYTTSGMSDSKTVDAQNGYEKALTSLLVALSGSNFIHDAAGLTEFAMTAAYKQYVIDNEINGMVMRAVRGIEVSDKTIGLDVFRRVGAGGNFVSDIHTARNMREEHYIPTISNRQTRIEWEREGKLTIEDIAIKKAKDLLSEHSPHSLSEELKKRIEKKFPDICVD